MSILVDAAILSVLIPLTLIIGYQWLLAIMALTTRSRAKAPSTASTTLKVLVLMPAHNEELCLGPTLASLKAVRYPSDCVHTVVIADRCTDQTVALARAEGVECLERNEGQAGKGPAIAWALERMGARREAYDALVILDADTLVDTEFLNAFVQGLSQGQQIQQGFCYISNPWQSFFTRIIAVTSMMRNGLFYAGKAAIGLPAMLAGTGMCFSRSIMDRYGWTAFSVGEDWEFSAALVMAGEKIHFNQGARVYQLESVGLRQASRQRLRWAGGKHEVAGTSAWTLVRRGIAHSSWYLADAGLTLLAPNYSTQASLVILSVLGSLAAFISGTPLGAIFLPWSLVLLLLLAAYFLLGALLTDSPGKALLGILMIPVFLPWRLAIEVLGLLGYGRTHWFRTTRVTSNHQ